jgi:hypothetical protein
MMSVTGAINSGKILGWMPKGHLYQAAGLNGPNKMNPTKSKFGVPTPKPAELVSGKRETPTPKPAESIDTKWAWPKPKPAEAIDSTIDSDSVKSLNHKKGLRPIGPLPAEQTKEHNLGPMPGERTMKSTNFVDAKYRPLNPMVAELIAKSDEAETS